MLGIQIFGWTEPDYGSHMLRKSSNGTAGIEYKHEIEQGFLCNQVLIQTFFGKNLIPIQRAAIKSSLNI